MQSCQLEVLAGKLLVVTKSLRQEDSDAPVPECQGIMLGLQQFHRLTSVVAPCEGDVRDQPAQQEKHMYIQKHQIDGYTIYCT